MPGGKFRTRHTSCNGFPVFIHVGVALLKEVILQRIQAPEALLVELLALIGRIEVACELLLSSSFAL